MSRDERNVNDEIHDWFPIPPAIHAILDTVAVQRLGSLMQLGVARMTCELKHGCC
jgi:HD superfamily phosphohydrolase